MSGFRGAVAVRSLHGRRVTQAVLDCTAWVIALVACTALRLGPDGLRMWRLAPFLPLIIGLQLGAGFFFGLYRSRWVFGSIEEATAVAKSGAVVGFGLLLVDASITTDRPLPISVVLAGASMALLIMVSLRFWWRTDHDRRIRRALAKQERQRVLVFGAGSGGRHAVAAMLSDTESAYVPVAFLDDNPRLRGMTFRGVNVIGSRLDMAAAAAEHRAHCLVIAVPSAPGPLVLELSELATRAGLSVRVLPSVRELLDGQVRVIDIREPTESDLLGRHRIETDVEAVAAYLTNKRVAVTGAGGSIGSELCRQIMRFHPSELLMLDRDESALHAVQLSIEGRALLDAPNLVLLDIRDRAGVHDAFQAHRPEVVFHAAALKHLPLLEKHPIEALKTNVWGSLAVLEAAEAVGVERFVNISTDKAANPCSVLGYSKRLAEGLTAGVDVRARGRFLSVRFGNVLGSRGSVLTSFRSQLEQGGPLTVTDPDATRYFMTVEEAVELVIQAGAIGGDGAAFVLDMGKPVRIAEVAEQLANTVEPPCSIEYTGLRPGEKLHEDLFGDTEVPECSAHPLIRTVLVPPVDGDCVRNLPTTVAAEIARSEMVALCESMALDLETARLAYSASDIDFPLNSWQVVAGE